MPLLQTGIKAQLPFQKSITNKFSKREFNNIDIKILSRWMEWVNLQSLVKPLKPEVNQKVLESVPEAEAKTLKMLIMKPKILSLSMVILAKSKK
jgi:hypothetical protein